MKVPVGSFEDWLGGLLAFFWLMAVVTVPWNIYFKAKAVLSDAQPTRERGLPVDERQVAYVKKLVGASLCIAIALHLASAVVLFVLAQIGVAPVGYVASVIALLLTALRPTLSAYEYLSERLRMIGQNWKYPREDVVELRARVETMESGVKEIRLQLDPEKPESLGVGRARPRGRIPPPGRIRGGRPGFAPGPPTRTITSGFPGKQSRRISQLTTDGQVPGPRARDPPLLQIRLIDGTERILMHGEVLPG